MKAEPSPIKAEPAAVKAEDANGVLPPGTVGPKMEHAAEATRGRDEKYLARILDPGAVAPSTHTNIAPPPESAPAGSAAGIATQDPGCAACFFRQQPLWHCRYEKPGSMPGRQTGSSVNMSFPHVSQHYEGSVPTGLEHIVTAGSASRKYTFCSAE